MSRSPAPVWSRRIADELWSGPVTPLTFSLLAEPMARRMVAEPLAAAGLPDLAGEPVLRLHASHVYVNARLLGAVIALLPSWLRSSGVLALLPDHHPPSGGLAEGALSSARAVAIALRLMRNDPTWAPWRRAVAFEAACARLRGVFGDKPATVPPESMPELHAAMAGVQRQLGDFLATVGWAMVYAYVFFHAMSELARRWGPELLADHADLTVGLPGIDSLAAHREVVALGALITRTRGSAAPGAGTSRPTWPPSRRTPAPSARHGAACSGATVTA
jgi:hypothetical protein